MLKTYQYPKFAYERPPELEPSSAGRKNKTYAAAVVGAGPVGMACAIDLKQRGIDCVLIDEDDTVSIGSRGVCYAKRTLEIFDRLKLGHEVVARGVSWNIGRTFFRDREVYHFNLLAEPDHERPAMINLQQYHLEEILQRRAKQCQVDMRWRQKVIDVQGSDQGLRLSVESPDGVYPLEAQWLVVADGARSSIRRMMGLDIEGKVFTDRFLIADVVMHADFPAERWFWFDPPFHPKQSVLLHRQADKLWRIDFQLGWDADPEQEKKPERVIPRIKAMLGDQHPFELEWVSVYTFQCRRMQSFRHGKVFFIGDAAHQVSPFGARGANSGIQDADNLSWKLARVIQGRSEACLLDSFNQERMGAADENILNSTRSTDFITPKSPISRIFRDATLSLADRYAFARSMVNSGRLSLPTHYLDSVLNTADRPEDDFHTAIFPGSPMVDAPLVYQGRKGWLLRELDGSFALLYVVGDALSDEAMASTPMQQWIKREAIKLIDLDLAHQMPGTEHTASAIAQRYDLRPGTILLIRPDQHLAARFRRVERVALEQAYRRACAAEDSVLTNTVQTFKHEDLATQNGSIKPADRDPLKLHPNFRDIDSPKLRDYQGSDRFYDMLIEAHRDLSDAESAALNARLLLVLANHIGDVSLLEQAIKAVKV